MPRDIPLWRWNDLTERRHSRPVEEQQSQQLDLFADNRRTIWLNQAHEALRCLDLVTAMAQYGKIIEAHLDDREICDELELAGIWNQRLDRYRESSRDVEQILQLYGGLADRFPSTLRTGLLEYLVAQVLAVEAPELVYIPSRFHVGLLCYELGNYEEAGLWFGRALDAGIQPVGRFLAYRGDALFRFGSEDVARELYREAFLRDPLSVDLAHLADNTIRELISEAESEMDEPSDILPWLPVWGWLRNVFTLDLNDLLADRSGYLQSLTEAESAERLTSPQLWFEYLRYAEFLRSSHRDDQELIRARRRMKEINGEMFGRYMKKIRGG
jgi:tetratricopeptide (TPR) repeat protein